MIGKIRILIASGILASMLCQNASAGVICECIGKAWDKAADKIVDCHKACQEHLKQKQSRHRQRHGRR